MDKSHLYSETTGGEEITKLKTLNPVKRLLGIYKSNIYFLDGDGIDFDEYSSIKSYDINSKKVETVYRDFGCDAATLDGNRYYLFSRNYSAMADFTSNLVYYNYKTGERGVLAKNIKSWDGTNINKPVYNMKAGNNCSLYSQVFGSNKKLIKDFGTKAGWLWDNETPGLIVFPTSRRSGKDEIWQDYTLNIKTGEFVELEPEITKDYYSSDEDDNE